MKTQSNEPAFSKAAFYHPDGGVDSPQEGLTKREYFATHAEIPWNAVITTLEIKHPGANITVREIIKYRAVLQVMAADALIEQLNKQP